MTYFYATEKTTQVVFDTVMHPSIMGSIQNLVQQHIPTRYNCTGDLTRIPQWWYFLCNVIILLENTTVCTTRQMVREVNVLQIITFDCTSMYGRKGTIIKIYVLGVLGSRFIHQFLICVASRKKGEKHNQSTI